VADSLTLTPIGVGAAYASPGEVQSAYLVSAGKTAVCLDLGAGALNRLQTHIAPERLAAVVISHLHPDHCVDLFSLCIYMAYGIGRGRRLRLIAPDGLLDRLVAFNGDRELWERCFTCEALDASGGPRDLGGGMSLTWAEVPHTKPTFALRIDRGGASVTYGADCGPNDALVELGRGTGVLIAECSHGAGPLPDDPIHLSAREAADIATRAGARRLLLTHCYPEYDRDAALRVAREGFSGPVGWAKQDGMVITSAG
jgi:ribonuclease BN (tRNA processing enzyme)